MNHNVISFTKKRRRNGGVFWFILFLVLAGLVSDAAAGLASGLAGSLALAAAAVLSALAQVTGFDGLNMFHGSYLHKKDHLNSSRFQRKCQRV
jgi:hypothetical protein